MRLPWNIGTEVEFQNPLSEDAHELKRKYELFLFDFFHCLQFHAISFFSSAPIRVRQEMRRRVNNGKQRTTLCWRASLYKNNLVQVSDTIEACYHNDPAQTRKINNFLSQLAY